MKIRHGFVSNSSSSSFVFRGIKVPFKTFLKTFDIDVENYDEETNSDCFEDFLSDEMKKKLPKSSKLEVVSTAYTGQYLEDSTEYTKSPVIIGYSLKDMDEGAYEEVPELSLEKEQKLINELLELPLKLNMDNLKTFVKFEAGY